MEGLIVKDNMQSNTARDIATENTLITPTRTPLPLAPSAGPSFCNEVCALKFL